MSPPLIQRFFCAFSPCSTRWIYSRHPVDAPLGQFYYSKSNRRVPRRLHILPRWPDDGSAAAFCCGMWVYSWWVVLLITCYCCVSMKLESSYGVLKEFRKTVVEDLFIWYPPLLLTSTWSRSYGCLRWLHTQTWLSVILQYNHPSSTFTIYKSMSTLEILVSYKRHYAFPPRQTYISPRLLSKNLSPLVAPGTSNSP